MALTYNEFIKRVGDIQFCKFLRNDWNHYGFQYKIGLNEDILPFYPIGSCKSGGLYFSDINNIHHFRGISPTIAIIQLLPDALYYIDPDEKERKYKTNKFMIVDVTHELCVDWKEGKIVSFGTSNDISGKQLFVHYIQEQYIIVSDTRLFGIFPYVIEFKDKKYARKIGNKYFVFGYDPRNFKLRILNGKPIDVSESNLLFYLFMTMQTRTNFFENIIKRLKELEIGGNDIITYLAKNIDEYVVDEHIEYVVDDHIEKEFVEKGFELYEPEYNIFFISTVVYPFENGYNICIDKKKSKLNIFRNMFVKKYPLMIQYINQTYAICELAIENDEKAFGLIQSHALRNMIKKHRPAIAKI